MASPTKTSSTNIFALRNFSFSNFSKPFCILILLILIISRTEAAAERNKNKNDIYDYYDDYYSMDDDGNYAELGAPIYDYDDKSEQIERIKKDAKNTDAKNSGEPEVDHGCEETTESAQSVATTCKPVASPSDCAAYLDKVYHTAPYNNEQPQKAKELRDLVQHLYISQARVQLEASEIKKAQAIANEAQQQLEEAANHVRAVTAALQNAQQEVATSAIRAQTAQLQLAAHDQLLFAARQDVDALSSRMVGVQAAEGIAQPQVNFDIGALMQKLRQPLTNNDRPTPVPSIAMPNSKVSPVHRPTDFYYDDNDDYVEH